MTFFEALIALLAGQAPSILNMTVLQVPFDTISCVQGR